MKSGLYLQEVIPICVFEHMIVDYVKEEMMNQGTVLAMYDIRGIQSYIYRTALVKDAMGASKLVEYIIEDALKEAVKKENMESNASLEWCNDEGPLAYDDLAHDNLDVDVLFVGGGNAYVLFSSELTCKKINERMSHYVIRKTFSLQLAIAVVDATGDYSNDYKKLHEEMNRVKAAMTISQPLGALPVMRTEIKTGYPVSVKSSIGAAESEETRLKHQMKEKIFREGEEKIFDNLVSEKGDDSTIAVIHLDGNNMGLRIRNLIKDKKTYEEAVAVMREISFNISDSYQRAFREMQSEILEKSGKDKAVIREIIIAGDDITYVCNASLALSSARRFCELISEKTMSKPKGHGKRGPSNSDKKKNLKEYGFSVCGGIAFCGSHFPFSIAYDVAEACCDKAKSRAKDPDNMGDNRIGNFLDFQICKDVRCRNLDDTREREYTTPSGENLLLRPYYIPTKNDFEIEKKLKNCEFNIERLNHYIQFFSNEENIPRSIAKKIRNTYPAGKTQINVLAAFMASRDWKLPGNTKDDEQMSCSGEKFWIDENDKNVKERKIAKFYDALELMDIEGKWTKEIENE